MPEEWETRLRDLYDRLDDELERLGVTCAGCGECCHFDRVDHVLYASGLERRYLKRHTSGEGARPEADAPVGLIEEGLRCPWQAGGNCLAREGRVLGCRLHFCVWPDLAGDEAAFLGRWHDALKALHDETGEAWAYRPLLPWGG